MLEGNSGLVESRREDELESRVTRIDKAYPMTSGPMLQVETAYIIKRPLPSPPAEVSSPKALGAGRGLRLSRE